MLESPPLISHLLGSLIVFLHQVFIIHWALTYISSAAHVGFISFIFNSRALRRFVTLTCIKRCSGWDELQFSVLRPGDRLDREPRWSVPQQTHGGGEIPPQSPGPAEKTRRLWRCGSGEWTKNINPGILRLFVPSCLKESCHDAGSCLSFFSQHHSWSPVMNIFAFVLIKRLATLPRRHLQVIHPH